jgi:tetratricopeptide (TPR) repeat protein
MKDSRTEQLLLRAIDLSTTSAECMNGSSLKAGYGLSYSRSWRLTLAQEEQTLVALKCFRNLPWLYSDLAHYYLITNRAALAEQAAREVVRLDSKIYFGYLFLGEALFLRGNLGESVLAYERALGAGGRNMEIFVGLAQANLRLGQYSQARKYALQLISTYPNQTDFRLVSLNPMDDDFQLLLDEVEKQRASQSGN